MKVKITLFCLVLAFAKAELSTAQNDLSDVLSDLVIISDRYVETAAEAAVMQSSAGWYNSAKSLDKFKFSLAFHANGLAFPENKKTFDINNSELRNVRIRGAESASVPTALGGDEPIFFDFNYDGEEYEFQAFVGIDTGFLAYPFLQGKVGLWQETELTVRYAPRVKIDKSRYAIYGIGLQHNLSQYLFKEDRPLDIAVLGSYSLFDLDLGFDPYAVRSTANSAPLAVVDSAVLDAHAILIQLIASKDYNNWTFSTGVGYNRSWIDYKLGGDDGFFLNVLNDLLTILSERQDSYKADLGATYHFTNWDLNTQLSVGNFMNLNVGAIYQLN